MKTLLDRIISAAALPKEINTARRKSITRDMNVDFERMSFFIVEIGLIPFPKKIYRALLIGIIFCGRKKAKENEFKFSVSFAFPV
jgi:hypothetical protein